MNNTLSQISSDKMSSIGYAVASTVVVVYTAVFLGVTLIVAAKRDPY